MNDLYGKVALITGGGQGLGEAICRTLASAGTVTLVADVREDLAGQTAAAIVADGGKASPIVFDVTDETQVEAAVRRILADHGRIDILVNNAGIDRVNAVEDLQITDWDRVIAVNLRGPFLLSRAVLPFMKSRWRGSIVNIVSTVAKRAWANSSAFTASKWGLLGLSQALHVEARPHRVKVTAVIAGGMRTPFQMDRFPEVNTDLLQDPRNVADTVRYVLMMPDESVIPEVMVIPMRESTWP